MRFLSVYSGIGAHDLGFERAGWTCAGQIEIEPFCRAVLEKHWPGLKRWSDVRDVTAQLVRDACGDVDCITGGFSCQDVSQSGRGAGIGRHTRSGLTWRNLFRLIRGLKPKHFVIENSVRLRTVGADRVLASLERIGYACWSVVVDPWWAGSPHSRPRVWITGTLENADCVRSSKSWQPENLSATSFNGKANQSVDAVRVDWPARPETIADIPRAIDGTAFRMDRLTAIGNCNPPVIAQAIAEAINAISIREKR